MTQEQESKLWELKGLIEGSGCRLHVDGAGTVSATFYWTSDGYKSYTLLYFSMVCGLENVLNTMEIFPFKKKTLYFQITAAFPSDETTTSISLYTPV